MRRARVKIATQRDELREIAGELEAILVSADRAVEAPDTAIDALSEYV